MPDLDFYDLENYDLDGPGNGLKYATGTATSLGSTTFTLANNGTLTFDYIKVTGLSFRPTRIIIHGMNTLTSNLFSLTTYTKRSRGEEPDSNGSKYNLALVGADTSGGGSINGAVVRVYELTGDGRTYASVGDSSFIMPVRLYHSITLTWEAFGV